MAYQDQENPVVAGQMFLRGGLLSAMVQAGLLKDTEAVCTAARTLKRCWDEMYPTTLLVQPAPSQPLPVSASPRPQPVPYAQPAVAPDASGLPFPQYPPTDMSTFFQWQGQKLWLGDRPCQKLGKPWKDVTFQELLDLDVEADRKDVGMLEWYVKQDPTEKPQYAQKNIEKHQRVKALILEIRRGGAEPALPPTPF